MLFSLLHLGYFSSVSLHGVIQHMSLVFHGKAKSVMSFMKCSLFLPQSDLLSSFFRDQEMVSRLQSDIKALETELKELETSGRTIENKLQSKSEHKKLTVF